MLQNDYNYITFILHCENLLTKKIKKDKMKVECDERIE